MMSDPEPDAGAEFAAFAGQFREAVLDACGIPEEERELWRQLR